MMFLSRRRGFRFCFGVILAAAILFIVKPGDRASAQEKDMAGRLAKDVNRVMAECGAPGAIVGFWKGDFAWSEAKGLANVEAGIPMKKSYVWRIGSVTKTFVATAILRLCDQGRLSLDDRLSRFRPNFPKADQITIRELLQHSAGIFNWADDDALREAVQKHPHRGWSMETMIRLAAKKPFYFEPGTGYHYSNVGYFLLAPIIEKAAGKGLAQVIQDEIAKPLGLRHTYMTEGPRYRDEVIHGYVSRGGKLKDTANLAFAKVINYDLAYTAGGMVSNLEDLHTWLQALADGRLLSRRMHEEQMKTIPMSGEKGTGYGLGVVRSRGWLGHSGGVAGSMCNVYINPKADAAIIMYFNKLDVVNLKQNESDLKAMGQLMSEMIQMATPTTLPQKKTQ